MPSIPAMSLTGQNLNIEEVYEDGLFHPAGTPDSFDVLNGQMDEDNLASTGIIPPFAIQPGALVGGTYLPFERWNFVYGRQLSGNEDRPVAIAGLCARLFKPWDARFILYGYQGWFHQDAGAYGAAGDGNGTTPDPIDGIEYWDLTMKINGDTRQGLTARLPHGRCLPAYNSDSGGRFNSERRWRYVSKIGALKRGVDSDGLLDKGYLSFQLRAWAKLVHPGSTEPDVYNAKLVVPTGGLWVMAFR